MLDALLGSWELNTINTANTGTPIDISYSPSAANDVSGLTNDQRGQAILRHNVSGPVGHSTMNNYTFTTPPPATHFGNLGRNSFCALNFEQWGLSANT